MLETQRHFSYYIHICPPSSYDKFSQLENQSDVSHFEKKVAKGFLTSWCIANTFYTLQRSDNMTLKKSCGTHVDDALYEVLFGEKMKQDGMYTSYHFNHYNCHHHRRHKALHNIWSLYLWIVFYTFYQQATLYHIKKHHQRVIFYSMWKKGRKEIVGLTCSLCALLVWICWAMGWWL